MKQWYIIGYIHFQWPPSERVPHIYTNVLKLEPYLSWGPTKSIKINIGLVGNMDHIESVINVKCKQMPKCKERATGILIKLQLSRLAPMAFGKESCL